VGLIATDGCLSGDGRHIDITSKDFQLLETVNEILPRRQKIASKQNGHGQSAYRIQIGDVAMYRWLLQLGLTPRKSLTIGKIAVPSEYFPDFFRGAFDGDGSVYWYYDKRWKNSLMFYTSITSASLRFAEYLRQVAKDQIGIHGSLNWAGGVYQLRYAKKETAILARWMYHANDLPYLLRKKIKIDRLCAGGETGTRITLRW